jgi:hypothetical protein
MCGKMAAGEPAFGKAPVDVGEAGLTATWVAVLSTFRSGRPDSVRDHALWLACAQAVAEVVAADAAEVYGEPASGLFNRLLGRPRMPCKSLAIPSRPPGRSFAGSATAP